MAAGFFGCEASPSLTFVGRARQVKGAEVGGVRDLKAELSAVASEWTAKG